MPVNLNSYTYLIIINSMTNRTDCPKSMLFRRAWFVPGILLIVTIEWLYVAQKTRDKTITTTG